MSEDRSGADAAGPFAGRRVLALGTFDSFIRTAVIVGRMFEARGASLRVAALGVASGTAQLSPRQLRAGGVLESIQKFGAEALVASELFRGSDVVIAAIDGGRARELFLALRARADARATKRPIVVIVSPGLSLTEQIAGFMSRAPADVLCFNTEREAALYRAAAADIGVDASNAVVTGLLGVDRSAGREAPTGRPLVVFFEQPVIPARRVQRAHILAGLIELARREPGADVLVKLRHARNETAHHATRFRLEDIARELFARGGRPANLAFTHESADILLERASLAVTVSSTVAVEAMARGVPTRIVSDFGVTETLGVDFFVGSGCLAPMASLGSVMEDVARPDWIASRSGVATDPGAMLSRCGSLLAEQDRLGAALPRRPLSPAYGSREWIDYALDAHGPVALHAPHLLDQFGRGRGLLRALALRLRPARRDRSRN